MLVQALYAIIRLSVLGGRLPAYGIGYASPCHEVAFVTAVNENLRPHGSPWRNLWCLGILQLDGAYGVSVLFGLHYAPFVPDIPVIADVRFGKEPLECSQGNLRLEAERGRGHSVVMAYAPVELSCESLYDTAVAGAVAYVRPSQSSSRHATKPLGWRD